eukprot:1308512-Amphidinium_carterae.1
MSDAEERVWNGTPSGARLCQPRRSGFLSNTLISTDSQGIIAASGSPMGLCLRQEAASTMAVSSYKKILTYIDASSGIQNKSLASHFGELQRVSVATCLLGETKIIYVYVILEDMQVMVRD